MSNGAYPKDQTIVFFLRSQLLRPDFIDRYDQPDKKHQFRTGVFCSSFCVLGELRTPVNLPEERPIGAEKPCSDRNFQRIYRTSTDVQQLAIAQLGGWAYTAFGFRRFAFLQQPARLV